MCGRFFRDEVSWREYYDALNLTGDPQPDLFDPAYNIAPTQTVPIIRLAHNSDRREAIAARWGLIPFFWKQPLKELKFPTFNARSETAAEKNTFRAPFRSKRCLVPISGFYEWKRIDKKTKIPHAIGLRNRRWFCLAGLWDQAHIDGMDITSFTVLTTQSNALMADIHNRMPVILHPDNFQRWLDPKSGDVTDLFRPYDPSDMHVRRVNPEVGNVRNQGKHLIEDAQTDQLF